MRNFFQSPFKIGNLTLPNRLIQGPLAGVSCAPFRAMFYRFTPPAYCVTEMISAHDIVHKHGVNSRYLYRALEETCVSYQISGTDPVIMAKAAKILENQGADILDINCGCPKPKIRKKGAGSALLENSDLLVNIIDKIRSSISIPLTVKIRIQGNDQDFSLAQRIERSGADALIVHGRRWMDDYDKTCDYVQIAKIKQLVQIPVIANGDIKDYTTLLHAQETTQCDAFMIGRAGTGRPWLYEELLNGKVFDLSFEDKEALLAIHLEGLTQLENAHQASLQSNKLKRYYLNQ